MHNLKKIISLGSDDQQTHYLEWVLILMGSLLVGIWAVKDTIALRNILLVTGALGSIFFFYRNKRSEVFRRLNANWLPILCIGIVFCWVVFHYFFLSISPEVQYHELVSNWLRCFLGSIFGLATGMALTRYPRYLFLSWLGILISFFLLFAQYVPLAWGLGDVYVPFPYWEFKRYLFIGKINPMFMGVLMIAGSTGYLLDAVNSGSKNFIRNACIFWLICLAMALYSFAFIINTRSGILLSSLIIGCWSIYGFLLLFTKRNSAFTLKSSTIRRFTYALVLALVLISVFAYQQIQRDSGWQQLIEDVKIGYQIEKYPQWQDVWTFGFPKTESGKVVTYNTYERVAWATAGVKSIANHPLGVGILILPLGLAAKELFPGVTPLSTHSGWVDLTLSFGLPFLALMWLANFTILYFAIRQKSPFKYTLITLSMVFFAVFTIGELSNGHSLEMLFYFFSLMSGIQIAQRAKVAGVNIA
jgi:hypothetical protein